MAFEGLSEKLSAALKRLRGKGRVTEADVKEAMKEVRLALLDADVSYGVVKDFVAKVTERAVGTDVLESLTPAQQIIKIVNEELTLLMGGGNEKLNIASHPPTVIMMVGLQGAGKTTNGAKLNSWTSPYLPWGRSIRSRSPSTPCATPGTTALTPFCWTPPAGSTLTSSS